LTSPPFSTAVLSVISAVYPSHPLTNTYFIACIESADKADILKYGSVVPDPFLKFLANCKYLKPDSQEAKQALSLADLLEIVDIKYKEFRAKSQGDDHFDQSFNVEDEDMRVNNANTFFTRPAPNRNKQNHFSHSQFLINTWDGAVNAIRGTIQAFNISDISAIKGLSGIVELGDEAINTADWNPLIFALYYS